MLTSLVIVQDDLQSATAITDSQESPQAPRQPSMSHSRKARAEVACKLARELQEVLRHASLALLRLSQPEALAGLLVHCSTTFEPFYEIADTVVEDNTASEFGGDEQQSPDTRRLQAGQTGASGHFDWMQAVALQVYIQTAHLCSQQRHQPCGQSHHCSTCSECIVDSACCLCVCSFTTPQSVMLWAQDKQQR